MHVPGIKSLQLNLEGNLYVERFMLPHWIGYYG